MSWNHASAPVGTGEALEPNQGAPCIVPMRRRHLRGVLRIERTTEHARWSSGLFLNELSAPNRCYLTALGSGRRPVLGYAGLLVTGPDAHVTTIAVHPDARRRSVGTRLLVVLARSALAQGVEAMTLEVAASNDAALSLYRHFGFDVAGVRQNYYADRGEDALVLWWRGLADRGAAQRLDAIESALVPELRTEGIDW